MTEPLRLVLFDVDGTLVDSHGDIVAAMSSSYEAQLLPVPDRDAILSTVGLSLPNAVARLSPEQSDKARQKLVNGYKEAYFDQRKALGAASSPLYAGALETLQSLNETPDLLLGVATGKSKRGLDALIEAHGLERYFVTRQVVDHHPSKPHPSMIDTARAETGVKATSTVMIGDTSFDMEMAKSAGVAGVGVTWGYHHRSALRDATCVIETFGQLPDVLACIWD